MKNNQNTTGYEEIPLDSHQQIVPASDNPIRTFEELFLDLLKDIYWAEKSLLKVLLKMANNASSSALRSCLIDHHQITQIQINRIEKMFDVLKQPYDSKKCDAMEGLIKEGDKMLMETEWGPIRDACIIASSQKIEHYEMAAYGTLLAFAQTLGENDIVKWLQQTLAEEKESDKLLSDIAFSCVNNKANQL